MLNTNGVRLGGPARNSLLVPHGNPSSSSSRVGSLFHKRHSKGVEPGTQQDGPERERSGSAHASPAETTNPNTRGCCFIAALIIGFAGVQFAQEYVHIGSSDNRLAGTFGEKHAVSLTPPSTAASVRSPSYSARGDSLSTHGGHADDTPAARKKQTAAITAWPRLNCTAVHRMLDVGLTTDEWYTSTREMNTLEGQSKRVLLRVDANDAPSVFESTSLPPANIAASYGLLVYRHSSKQNELEELKFLNAVKNPGPHLNRQWGACTMRVKPTDTHTHVVFVADLLPTAQATTKNQKLGSVYGVLDYLQPRIDINTCDRLRVAYSLVDSVHELDSHGLRYWDWKWSQWGFTNKGRLVLIDVGGTDTHTDDKELSATDLYPTHSANRSTAAAETTTKETESETRKMRAARDAMAMKRFLRLSKMVRKRFWHAGLDGENCPVSNHEQILLKLRSALAQARDAERSKGVEPMSIWQHMSRARFAQSVWFASRAIAISLAPDAILAHANVSSASKTLLHDTIAAFELLQADLANYTMSRTLGPATFAHAAIRDLITRSCGGVDDILSRDLRPKNNNFTSTQ
jgi:hypothetical protein